MTDIAAREARNRFGRLLDAAQSSPVRVTKKGRAVGIVMSIKHYDRLCGVAWAQLSATMDRMGAAAAAHGLTDDKLDALLVDES